MSLLTLSQTQGDTNKQFKAQEKGNASRVVVR
jgi:hypothetical protein